MADYGELLLQGMNTGSSMYARGAELSLRRQQLESERALRQLQQEHIAQQMQLEMAKYHEEVDKRAATAKAAAEFEVLNAPTISGISESGETIQVPNPYKAPTPGHAFIQAFAKTATNPKEAADIASTGVLMNLRESQADWNSRREGIDILKEQGRNERAQDRIDLGMLKLDEQKSYHQAFMDARNRGIDEREAHNLAMEGIADRREQGIQSRFERKLEEAKKVGGSKAAFLAHYADAMKEDRRSAERDEYAAQKALETAQKSDDKDLIEIARREYELALKKRRNVARQNAKKMEAYLIGAGVFGDEEGDAVPTKKSDSDDPDIPMLAPDGKTRGTVKRSKVDGALAKGYQLIK